MRRHTVTTASPAPLRRLGERGRRPAGGQRSGGVHLVCLHLLGLLNQPKLSAGVWFRA
jgi:hypothetical protein